MKPTHRLFPLLRCFPALGLCALLTACHDKSLTAQLQEDVDKAAERVRIQTIEVENLNKECSSLDAKLREVGSKKDELAAETSRSAGTLKTLAGYRESLEKELNTLTEATAKYRKEQLRP